MACSNPVEYRVAFPSPIKPSISIDRLDETLLGSGLHVQYHVFPTVLTRSAAKRQALSLGKEVLAFVKRSSAASTASIPKDHGNVHEQMTVEADAQAAATSSKAIAAELKSNEENKGDRIRKDKVSYGEAKRMKPAVSASTVSIPNFHGEVHVAEADAQVAATSSKAIDAGKFGLLNSNEGQVSDVTNVAIDCDAEHALAKRMIVPDTEPTRKMKMGAEIESMKLNVLDAQTAHETNLNYNGKTYSGNNLTALSNQSMCEKLDLLLVKMEKLTKEVNLYLSEGTTRRLVVLDLLSLQVTMLNFFLQTHAGERKYDSEYCLLKKLLAFQDMKSITFYRFYWFFFNEIVYQGENNFNVCKMWQQKFQDFKPSLLQLQQPQDYSKYKENIIGTCEAQNAALLGRKWLEKAANNLIKFGSTVGVHCPMSACHMIDNLGFYISVLVCDRNGVIHIVENLFQWPDEEMESRKNMRKRKKNFTDGRRDKRVVNQSEDTKARPAANQIQDTKARQATQIQDTKARQATAENSEVSFPFPINGKVVEKVVLFLEDIVQSPELFEAADLKPLRMNILWFGKVLLNFCQNALEKAKAAQ